MAEMKDAHLTAVKDINAAAVSSNPDQAGARIAEGPDLGMGEGGRVARVSQEADEILAVQVELADAAVGAHPEDAVGAEVEGDHLIIGQGELVVGLMAVVEEEFTVWVKMAETAGVGPDPQCAVGVGYEAVDGGIKESAGMVRVAAVRSVGFETIE